MDWKFFGYIVAAMALQANAKEPAQVNDATAPAIRLHIGDTGIRCARLPCPTKGIFLPGGHGLAGRKNLLYTDHDGRLSLPRLIGDEAAVAAVTQAWREMGCVAIDGLLIATENETLVLRIDRVIGHCHQHTP